MLECDHNWFTYYQDEKQYILTGFENTDKLDLACIKCGAKKREQEGSTHA